jgi:hypothetical protein
VGTQTVIIRLLYDNHLAVNHQAPSVRSAPRVLITIALWICFEGTGQRLQTTSRKAISSDELATCRVVFQHVTTHLPTRPLQSSVCLQTELLPISCAMFGFKRST